MTLFLNQNINLHQPRSYRLEESSFTKYNDVEFYERYRFNKKCVHVLAEELKGDLERETNRSHALSVENQILIALRYYAAGSFQQVSGDTIGISQASVSRSVTAVSKAICKRLLNKYIRLPTRDEAEVQKKKFFELAGLPGVISCLDGMHIRIVKPHENEEQFVNRKGYHSVNVQAACNADFQFTNVVVKWPGSTHDAHILRESLFWETFENDPSLGIVLGDSAYPLKYWLLTPLHQPTTPAEKYYNKCHRKTRVTIEKAFGQLKRRFSVLHQENRWALENVVYDIAACFVLHNFAKCNQQPDIEGTDDHETVDCMRDASENDDVIVGRERRQQIISALWRNRHFPGDHEIEEEY